MMVNEVIEMVLNAAQEILVCGSFIILVLVLTDNRNFYWMDNINNTYNIDGTII